ncbi:thiopeptide-type bacteriocin biosynthesis protein [Kitasatospora sp. NPDC088351]|uniref:thiopeptide-type bacteriocin biosynthesis protein n=1 Tax=Kitasatospora sp. NPDC088351 TaxID=3155180 RepID=UPI00342E5F2E
MTDTAKPPWLHYHLHLTDIGAAEKSAAQYLGPALTALENEGVVTSWHFLRKGDRWRLRYQPPTPERADAAAAAVDAVLENCRTSNVITGWTSVIYEPETLAFGGQEAMEVTHRLFHLDSHRTLSYLRAVHSAQQVDHRRELSVLLGIAMMRGAGLDWYEIGDTWATVAENRPSAPGVDPGRRLRNSVGALLRADTGPTSTLLTVGQLSFAAPWFAAFTECGRELRVLADNGRLRRGLRAVLAHHQLFHANRLGITHQHQALLATAAATTVLGLTPEAS